MRDRRPFLTAHWRDLVIVNYVVEPGLLAPLTPAGVELDIYRGECLVSMVGFLFEHTRFLGRLPLPGLSSFEEVNLRFYVKRKVDDEVRRGVVFVKELVPSRCVAWAARTFYQENYWYAPMRHQVQRPEHNGTRDATGAFAYQWRQTDGWATLSAVVRGPCVPLVEGELADFITEHYWGYCSQRSGATVEYQVAHPSWDVWRTDSCRFDADVKSLYGAEFVDALCATPHSSLVARGSDVAVYRGTRLTQS